MKRIIPILVSLLLLVACLPNAAPDALPSAILQTPEPQTELVISKPSAAEPTAVPIPVDSLQPNAAIPAEPEPIASSVPSSPVTSLSLSDVCATEKLTHPLPIELMTRDFDRSKADPAGNYETTYRRETVDCADLDLGLTALDADEAHTRLKLHVRFPSEWTLLVSRNMNEFFLNFRVLLDGERVPFTVSAKNVRPDADSLSDRCGDYELVLASDAVNIHTLAAYRTLTLMPYVLCYDLNPEGNRWRKDADGADVFLSFTHAFAGRFDLIDLNERSLSVNLSAVTGGVTPSPLVTREPVLRENMYSMEEIETDIRMELRGDVIDSDEETGEVTWAPPTEDTETLVELRARLALCPAEDTFMPFDPNALTYRNEPYVIRSGDGTLLYLNFRKNAVEISTLRNGLIQDAHTVWNGGFYGEPWHRTLDHITVTNASAEDTVNAALTSAGLSEQFGIGLCEKGRLAHAIVDAPYYETLSEGYILYVSRNGGGYMPVPKGGGRFEEDSKSALFEPPSEDSYAKSWQQDWIEIYVSENGIGHIGWYDPNELVAVANENVELLPFAEIQAHIRDDLRYSYAWTDEKNVGMAELHVKRIVLSCAIARIPNNPDEAALVPAWVVFCSDARSEAVNAHDRLMLINAIDGSYLHVR